jgi:hypothetical protein
LVTSLVFSSFSFVSVGIYIACIMVDIYRVHLVRVDNRAHSFRYDTQSQYINPNAHVPFNCGSVIRLEVKHRNIVSFRCTWVHSNFCGILVALFSVMCSVLSACVYGFWLTPLFVGFLLLSLVFCVVCCMPVFTAVG